MAFLLAPRIFGRISLEEVVDPKTKKVIVKKGELINKLASKKIDETGIEKLRVRSPLSCKTKFGVCRKCYGYDLGRNELVQLGEAVGIVTAQAIGEPGTQLTMRTFHTGGIAGGLDITQGLPRVEEIFEARSPRGKAVLSEVDGKVIDIKEKGGQNIIIIEAKEDKKAELKTKHKSDEKSKRRGTKLREYIVPFRVGLWIKKGDKILRGQQLCEGPADLKELFNLANEEAVWRYIVKEVQAIYSSQGSGLHDKHIEIIVKQMFSRIRVKDQGDTELLPGVVLEKDIFREANDKLKKGQKPATCQQLLLGITKVSLTTESFLSAASFQETVRVLINAAIEGKIDYLRGLKENVIIGKLIPAGTGFRWKTKKA